MDFSEKPPRQYIKVIFKCLGLGILLVACVLNWYMGIENTVTYLRVGDHAVTVRGTVTRVEEYEDSEDGTSWRVYITYTYGKKEYTAQYMDSGNSKWKNSLGMEITTQINPETPGQLMKDLCLDARNGILFGCIFGALLLRLLFWRTRKSWTECYGVNPSSIHRELVDTHRRRVNWACFLLVGGILLPLCVFIPEIYNAFPLVVGVVCVIIGVYLLIGYWNTLRHIGNRDYQIRHDSLVDKDTTYDTDSGTTYYLVYSDGKNTWRHSVGKKKYDAARLGDRTQAVYLPGKKRPIAWFDPDRESGTV